MLGSSPSRLGTSIGGASWLQLVGLCSCLLRGCSGAGSGIRAMGARCCASHREKLTHECHPRALQCLEPRREAEAQPVCRNSFCKGLLPCSQLISLCSSFQGFFLTVSVSWRNKQKIFWTLLIKMEISGWGVEIVGVFATQCRFCFCLLRCVLGAKTGGSVPTYSTDLQNPKPRGCVSACALCCLLS